MIGFTDHNTPPTNLPVLAYPSGTRNVRYLTLVPQNVTRGTITMRRVRGYAYWSTTNQPTTFLESDIFECIQLVPVRDGAIVDLSVLNPANLADMESNRVIWRRTLNLFAGTVSRSDSAGAQRIGWTQQPMPEVDIKSQRRWARDTWALIYTVNLPTATELNYANTLDLRGLFAAPDAL